ncbi:MAG TPA: ABC transporter permease [Limnochordia bacterium]|nr:ABC transporter permease [Limnochordia bacterium]
MPNKEYSAEHLAYLRGRRLHSLLVRSAQLLIVLGFFLLWEVAASKGWINAFIFSQPTKIWTATLRLAREGELWRHLGWTVWETVLGFSIGTAAGIAIAVLLWWSTFVSKVMDPYIVVLNSVPKVALGPIFVVWLGTTITAVVAMAVSVSIIVTIMMMHTGFKEVDPNQIKLVRTFGGTKGQVLRKVVIPASVPTMIAALKVNVGLSLVGTIVGEFLASKAGLGYLIIYGGQVFNMSLVMASILLLLVVSVILYYIVSFFEEKVSGGRA